jgi:hypothetical protein
MAAADRLELQSTDGFGVLQVRTFLAREGSESRTKLVAVLLALSNSTDCVYYATAPGWEHISLCFYSRKIVGFAIHGDKGMQACSFVAHVPSVYAALSVAYNRFNGFDVPEDLLMSAFATTDADIPHLNIYLGIVQSKLDELKENREKVLRDESRRRAILGIYGAKFEQTLGLKKGGGSRRKSRRTRRTRGTRKSRRAHRSRRR